MPEPQKGITTEEKIFRWSLAFCFLGLTITSSYFLEGKAVAPITIGLMSIAWPFFVQSETHRFISESRGIREIYEPKLKTLLRVDQAATIILGATALGMVLK